jgi:hypothetical protein
VLHSYAWQRKSETPEAREALLRAEAEPLAERVRAHLTSTDPAERPTLLVVATPPLGCTAITSRSYRKKGQKAPDLVVGG